MRYNFDPSQETVEEWLRRMHLNDKLDQEWSNAKEEKEEKEKTNTAADDVGRSNDCRGFSESFRSKTS